jgi:hypothetical protein
MRSPDIESACRALVGDVHGRPPIRHSSPISLTSPRGRHLDLT